MTTLDYSSVENDPVPLLRDTHDSNLAFCIHRNKNKNVVVYSAKLRENNTIDPAHPLDVYWIMFENAGNPREDLNLIERQSAYGATAKPRKGYPDQYEITVTSIKDAVIYLALEDGKVVARTTINGVENCILHRAFVYSTSSWGLPKVQHVEVHGVDPNGSPIMQKKLP